MNVQKLFVSIVGILVLLSFSGVSYAKSMVFPAKGQSQEQQDQDEFSCYKWAVQETGVDPKNMTATAAPQQESTAGSAAGGAARGAALGAIGGAIAGDAGKGAAIGAAVGGGTSAIGSRRRNRGRKEASQQEAQMKQGAMAEYDKAWGLCMKGKGYEVG